MKCMNRLSVQQTFQFRDTLQALIATEDQFHPYDDPALLHLLKQDFPNTTIGQIEYHRSIVLKIPGADKRRRKYEETKDANK